MSASRRPWYEEQQGYVADEHPARTLQLERRPGSAQTCSRKQPDRVAELKKALAEIRSKGQVR